MARSGAISVAGKSGISKRDGSVRMNALRKKLLGVALTTGVLLGSVIGASPAAATFSDYVIVEDHTYQPGWPVWEAVAAVDQYTSSKMVNGVCTTNYRCVRIYESRWEPSYQIGWTDMKWWWPTGGPWIGQIKVQYDWRNSDYYFKYKILVHELGHAFFLPHADDGYVMSSSIQQITCVCFNPVHSAHLLNY